MACIDEIKVNTLYECNLLHDIISPPKHTKQLNICYSSILQGCMNTRKGKEKFKNFQILLYGGCSYIIVMGRLIQNLLLNNTMWCSIKHKRVLLLPI